MVFRAVEIDSFSASAVTIVAAVNLRREIMTSVMLHMVSMFSNLR